MSSNYAPPGFPRPVYRGGFHPVWATHPVAPPTPFMPFYMNPHFSYSNHAAPIVANHVGPQNPLGPIGPPRASGLPRASGPSQLPGNLVNPGNPLTHGSHAAHVSHAAHGPTGSNIKVHVCRNCGVAGHLYKECPQPIMSFGLLCYRIDDHGHVEYLMIQRKDSLSFIEFIRGRYDPSNMAYIARLIQNMTDYERGFLLQYSFNMLWNHVWHQSFLPRETQEYYEAKEKFESLRRGDHGFHLNEIVERTPALFKEPEWGFPKGRRRLKERDVDCAVREFCEETAFKREDVLLHEEIKPFEEIFYGTNNVLYRHVYYVARIRDSVARGVVKVDPNNIHQAREVRQIRWFPMEDVLCHIRHHNIERKLLFQDANAVLKAHLAKAGLASASLGTAKSDRVRV